MIEILDFESKKVVPVRMKGKISTEDIEKIASYIEEKLQDFEKLSIYVEVETFEGISIDAFFKDIKFGIKNFSRFDKKAVVTDKSWMRKVGDFSDRLFSSIEIKCFSFDQKDEAVKWVSE